MYVKFVKKVFKIIAKSTFFAPTVDKNNVGPKKMLASFPFQKMSKAFGTYPIVPKKFFFGEGQVPKVARFLGQVFFN